MSSAIISMQLANGAIIGVAVAQDAQNIQNTILKYDSVQKAETLIRRGFIKSLRGSLRDTVFFNRDLCSAKNADNCIESPNFNSFCECFDNSIWQHFHFKNNAWFICHGINDMQAIS
jgi:hypothetical protein